MGSLSIGFIIMLQGFLATPAFAQYYQGASYYPYQQPYYNNQYGQSSYYNQYPYYNNQYNYLPAQAGGYGYGYQSYCPQLSYNLVLGSSDYGTGGQVSMLQRFLQMRYGALQVSGYFDQSTYYYVAQFQREQAVYPITGGVGPLTRAAIARTCLPGQGGGYPYPYGQLSITGVSGPTQLQVGQGAEWTVSVRDYSGHLTYSATWGDEGQYGYASASAVTSTGSLSHSYLMQGTYTPRFTVTNAFGRSVTASITVVVTGGLPGQGCSYYYPWTCQEGFQYPYSSSPYGY